MPLTVPMWTGSTSPQKEQVEAFAEHPLVRCIATDSRFGDRLSKRNGPRPRSCTHLVCCGVLGEMNTWMIAMVS